MSTSTSNKSSGDSAEVDGPLLPKGFSFSQGSLQDFQDCPRRFLLRHIESRPYPAPEAEPIRLNERRKERGVRFHELLCQEHSGVPRQAISRMAAVDENLKIWWERFTYREPVGEAAETYAELPLEGEIGGYPLMATFDLVAKRPDGSFEIFDWKTSEYRPGRDRIASWLQTKVYPYLLLQAGSWMNDGDSISPDDVQMTYWFAQHPDEPATFEYSDYQQKVDENHLTNLIGKILAREERPHFEKTDNEDHCRFCTYRSHCGRGNQAGNIEDGETYLKEVESLEATIEDVEEIEF